MVAINVKCPSCNYSGKLSLKNAPSDRAVICPKCRHKFPLEMAAADLPNHALCPAGAAPVEDEAQAKNRSAQRVVPSQHSAAVGAPTNRSVARAVRAEDVAVAAQRRAATPHTPHTHTPHTPRRTLTNAVTLGVVALSLIWIASGLYDREARQQEAVAHNAAEAQRADAGAAPNPREPLKETEEDRRVVAELRAVAQRAREEGEFCVAACRRNVSRLRGEADPGKDAAESSYESNLNDSVQETERQMHAIPRKSVLYDKYYLNVSNLVGTVVRLNSLRINPNKDDYEREVNLWVARHQVLLAAVQTSEPKQ